MENMKTKVSVVVPVYNVEKWLSECLDSIIDQTFTDFEVICIDDGSSDNSWDIMQEYASKDNRIKIYKNDSNRGLSYTRNRGIDLASGEYIQFLDSDDMLSRQALEKCVDLADADNLDMLLFDYEYLIEDDFEGKRKKPDLHNYYGIEGVWTGKNLFKKLELEWRFTVHACFKFFRLNFLKVNDFRFHEGIVHEDYLFSFNCMMKAKKIRCLDQEIYIYRRRKGAITDIVNERRAQSHFYNFIVMWDYWNQNEFSKELDKAIGHLLDTCFRGYLNNRYSGQIDEEFHFGEGAEEYLYKIFQNLNVNRLRISNDKWERIKNASKTYIYGAGKIAREVYSEFVLHDINPTAFLVTKRNEEDFYFGKPVLSVDELENDSLLLIVIAVSKKYREEIKQELESRGIMNYITLQDAS